jgi:hypothetical protein
VVLIVVVGACLSAILFAADRLGSGFLILAVLFAIVADFPHVAQTYVRLALNGDEWSRFRREAVVSFIGLAAVGVACVATSRYWIVAMMWVYWQPYHVMKQHFGVTNLYARKQGGTFDRRTVKVLLFAGCLAPVSFFVLKHGIHFGVYRLGDTRLPFSGLRVPSPPLDWAVPAGLYLLALLAAGAFVRQQLSARRDGKGLVPVALAQLALALVTYNLAYLLVSDLYAVILIATAVHSVQYHVLSWRLSTSRQQSRCRPAALLQPIAARRGMTLGAAALLPVLVAAGLLGAGSELVVAGAIPALITIHHFYLDSIMWKRDRNPDLGFQLGMAPRQPVGAVA